MSLTISIYILTHANGRVNDRLMRHPADSKYIEFSSKPHNVRPRFATDGFNPYGNMSSTLSTWKRSSFMLSLLIPAPNSLKKDINIYLQPLVEELKDLWDVGVKTFDVSSKKSFQMHAALL